jgi:L-alanine-DL-glutamate epimerase-like enolase superfamily enzyme
MRRPFTITGYTFEAMPSVIVTLREGAFAGRGEAAGVYYLGDDPAHMTAEVERVRAEVESGATREDLLTLLPAGGARNALDCALWELEAARAGAPVWKLAGLAPPKPIVTAMTAGADTPDAMARSACEFAGAQAIKLKLTGEPDLDARRVEAVRAALPGVWLGVDANQGYTVTRLRSVLRAFQRADVRLIEQPLPRGAEAELDGFDSPIPLAADESVQASADLDAARGRFDIINIKLDKCGGLTEALRMADRARAMGLGLMVGNMAGTSWAMAPAFLVGQGCDVVDLDGPLSLAADREPAAVYEGGRIWCGDAVWGAGAPVEDDVRDFHV